MKHYWGVFRNLIPVRLIPYDHAVVKYPIFDVQYHNPMAEILHDELCTFLEPYKAITPSGGEYGPVMDNKITVQCIERSEKDNEIVKFIYISWRDSNLRIGFDIHCFTDNPPVYILTQK